MEGKNCSEQRDAWMFISVVHMYDFTGFRPLKQRPKWIGCGRKNFLYGSGVNVLPHWSGWNGE